MVEQVIYVTTSLESRPAALFVQTASKFVSDIYMKIDNKTVNAKSIMGILSLGVLDGQEVIILANGEDARQAVDELKNFLTSEN